MENSCIRDETNRWICYFSMLKRYKLVPRSNGESLGYIKRQNTILWDRVFYFLLDFTLCSYRRLQYYRSISLHKLNTYTVQVYLATFSNCKKWCFNIKLALFFKRHHLLQNMSRHVTLNLRLIWKSLRIYKKHKMTLFIIWMSDRGRDRLGPLKWVP